MARKPQVSRSENTGNGTECPLFVIPQCPRFRTDNALQCLSGSIISQWKDNKSSRNNLQYSRFILLVFSPKINHPVFNFHIVLIENEGLVSTILTSSPCRRPSWSSAPPSSAWLTCRRWPAPWSAWCARRPRPPSSAIKYYITGPSQKTFPGIPYHCWTWEASCKIIFCWSETYSSGEQGYFL